ncbi:hypothetical protein C8J57DRAFT_1387935 [Mycena rebaudengoi]|nr:hypothetical protein C8J57DRAFT_1387935 [Mycena rebaudengoi]
MRLLSSSLLLLLLSATECLADSNNAMYPPGLQPLITRANVLLSSGQFSDAARVYSEAIDQSPLDYLLFYKRATAYLQMGRHAPALDDFAHVLTLTPLPAAHLMQARIHAKDGRWALARQQLALYAPKSEKEGAEKEALLADVAEAEAAERDATGARKAQLWTKCVESASRALRTATHSVGVRTMRVECELGAGDIEGAALYALTFRLSFFLLPPSPVPANALKSCLHSDPESPLCLPLHRLSKGLERGFKDVEELEGAGDWRGVLNVLLKGGKRKGEVWARWEEAAGREMAMTTLAGTTIDDLHFGLRSTGSKNEPSAITLPSVAHTSPRRRTLLRALCKAHTQIEMYRRGEEWCKLLRGMEGGEEDADALRGIGEALVVQEEYEEGVRYLERAFEATGRSDREFQARLQKAQRLLKQSRAKDYYKVLGVARDADAKTIKKAFRTAAKTAHPDKGGSEAKMAAVNEAYEVLSKPELRARFDNGDDPNDPMAQQGPGGGGHPFAQFFQQQSGGFPGGGGGFQFHFQHGH